MTPLPTMREITALVAERYGLTVEGLRGPSRARRLAYPRHEAFALIHAGGRASTTKIGQYFNRCHSAVVQGIRGHHARTGQRP